MPGSFWRQFAALCRKNWIILWHYKIINIIRCLILPIAYALFFANAQNFFSLIGVLGNGHITNLQPLSSNFDKFKLIYALPQNNDTSAALAQELWNRAIGDRYSNARIIQVNNSNQVDANCPTNFNGKSDCWAGVVFSGVDPVNNQLNYTFRADIGLANVDVNNPSQDDVQQRLLPLQWAIEANFINMSTGVFPPTPQVWEYTNQSADELKETNRINYMGGIRDLLALAFFIVFLGVVYQLPGSIASERSNLLTSHLEAMGCRRSARFISWNLSLSAVYLPAWILVGVIFQKFIFKNTSLGLYIAFNIITGLSLASWSQLVVVGFKDASTLAAIFTTFLAIVLAIIAQFMKASPTLELVLTFLFPPMFYIYFTKALVGWERTNPLERMSLTRRGPENDAPIALLLILAIIDIFLFPMIAAYLEHKIYGVKPPGYVGFWRRLFSKSKKEEDGENHDLPENVAVQLEHVRKVYKTSLFGKLSRRKDVIAIEDLSFSVPKGEIFCLLGRNGAAKSTTLHTIAKLISATSGKIRYAPDLHPGIASQKDVLWDELNCMQHIELWRRIKSTPQNHQYETDLELLQRSDLGPKVKFLSKNLSGGQKRKLQLACALAGGSNLLLLDEITSGLDPLSRRAIWKLISANRGRASIILTTHFLDEADYLGDQVAILKQPGQLLALDNPVGLKTQLGKGFVLSIDQNGRTPVEITDPALRTGLIENEIKGKKLYFTGSNNYGAIRKLISNLDHRRSAGEMIKYQINSATLEQVFLDLNTDKNPEISDSDLTGTTKVGGILTPNGSSTKEIVPLETTRSYDDKILSPDLSDKDLEATSYPPTSTLAASPVLMLHPGQKRNSILSIPIDAFTIFLKRGIVFRRAWVLPIIGMLVTIAAACIPLGYMIDRVQTCALLVRNRRLQSLSYPFSIYPAGFSPVLLSPSNILNQAPAVLPFVRRLADNSTFIDTISNNIVNITYGGISLSDNPGIAQSLFAYEGTPFLQKGQSVLNFMSNAILDNLAPPNITGLGIGQVGNLFRINLQFRFMAAPDFTSTAQSMKWIGFFGLGMAVWPAFAVIYPTQERASNVRSNQYSNGASPVALWLGHLLWEVPPIILVSTIITIIFATASSQFNGIGYVWFCLVLYGISSTLYSFLFALFLNSPLASWALVAGINVVIFMLYLASYLLILTYDRSAYAADHMTIAHFTTSLINPVPSILRAILVSVNLFNLLCDGLGNYSSRPYSHILEFGGPILYMFVQSAFAFSILVYVDSGSPLPLWLVRRSQKAQNIAGLGAKVDEKSLDVDEEKERLANGADDMLQVLGLKKRYRGSSALAVDDVSFGVDTGQNFALIGPNGAGKTTTLACIRGVELPTSGDITVARNSIIHSKNAARAQLGVCPQVNTIDQHLTVAQHLWVYGRLKGVPRKLLKSDIHALLSAAGLLPKANQLATSLSGGNQRKLGLAIALIGDRPVLLIDEFSSGVDPFSKREAWQTLAALTKDRAVVQTTHSMEEVDALSSKVGIIAQRMLAVGTPEALKSRYATYEIHLAANAVDQMLVYLKEHGFNQADRSLDTLTRISITGVKEDGIGKLLEVLEKATGEMNIEATVHEASTETAFLSIVREHNVREEESRKGNKPSLWSRMFGKSQG